MSDTDDEYDHYKSIALKERSTGKFSDNSISAHHTILKNNFYKMLKRKIFTSSINFIISFALVTIVIFAFCKNNNIPFSEANNILRYLLSMWSLTFLIFTTVRVVSYPTRKRAKQDLIFIHAIEESIDNPNFVA